MIVIGGTYRHFKGGIYKVIAIATHSETDEPMVVYAGDSGTWVRPLPMFEETVDLDGRQVPRFQLM